jgi:VWFA-related protein
MRALVVTVAICAPVLAQQPVFKSGVELVTVPVTVTSLDRNTHVAGLTPADFRVEENGDRQEVTVVTRERVPVSVAIVVDSSAAMTLQMRREFASEAVNKLVAALDPEDEVTILFLSRTVSERLPWTRVKEIRELNWGGWNPNGTAPLHDGLRAAFAALQKARTGRRAILLLTPGFESSSRMSLSNLVKSRQESEVSLYAFGLGSHRAEEVAAEQQSATKYVGAPRVSSDMVRGADAQGPNVIAPKPLMEVDYLDTLVGDSGGEVRRILSLPEATMAANNLVAELHNQYLVGFTPKKTFDGKYRKLKIEVNRRGLYVRHREGYLALPAGMAQ